jgi:hypothetical protein
MKVKRAKGETSCWIKGRRRGNFELACRGEAMRQV